MSAAQVDHLAQLMRDGLPTRPEGVVQAALLVDGERVRLVAFWRDRRTLDAYLSTVEVPRGVELMRIAGVEPEWQVVEVRELG